MVGALVLAGGGGAGGGGAVGGADGGGGDCAGPTESGGAGGTGMTGGRGGGGGTTGSAWTWMRVCDAAGGAAVRSFDAVVHDDRSMTGRRTHAPALALVIGLSRHGSPSQLGRNRRGLARRRPRRRRRNNLRWRGWRRRYNLTGNARTHWSGGQRRLSGRGEAGCRLPWCRGHDRNRADR